jgi:hypothetical protein
MDSRVGSRKRFDATDLPALRDQLNSAFQVLGSGAAQLSGLRLDVRAAIPTGAPQSSGTPNIVLVNDTGTYKIYWWNGSSWVTPATGSSGEINTGSNVNATGVGVFKQKTGVNLEFRGVSAGSSKVTAALDGPNNSVAVDVVEANLSHANIGGTVGTTQIAADAVTYAKMQNVTDKRVIGRDAGSTGDPQEITPVQSIQLDGAANLKLVGDTAAPGNSKLYGTDGAGTRGWYAQPGTGTGFLRHASANQIVAADTTQVVGSEYEIVSGFYTEIGARGVLEIS